MTDEADILRDPGFRDMLKIRSRWRWGLSGGLIGAYFAYCLAGIWFSDIYARPVFGSSISLGIALGYLIIALAVVLSLLYVRIVGRLLEESARKRESVP